MYGTLSRRCSSQAGLLKRAAATPSHSLAPEPVRSPLHSPQSIRLHAERLRAAVCHCCGQAAAGIAGVAHRLAGDAEMAREAGKERMSLRVAVLRPYYWAYANGG